MVPGVISLCMPRVVHSTFPAPHSPAKDTLHVLIKFHDLATTPQPRHLFILPRSTQQRSMVKSIRNPCRTFKAMIWCGFSTIWTGYVVTPLFPTLRLNQYRLSICSTPRLRARAQIHMRHYDDITNLARAFVSASESRYTSSGIGRFRCRVRRVPRLVKGPRQDASTKATKARYGNAWDIEASSPSSVSGLPPWSCRHPFRSGDSFPGALVYCTEAGHICYILHTTKIGTVGLVG